MLGDTAYDAQYRAVTARDHDEARIVQHGAHIAQVLGGGHPAVFSEVERAHESLDHLQSRRMLRVMNEADKSAFHVLAWFMLVVAS